MAKTEVGSSTELVQLETPEQAIAAIKGEVVPELEDPEAVARSIVDRILSATTPEEVLGGNAAVHAQDVIGRPFSLRAVRFLRSRFDQGPGVFAVLDAAFQDTGELAAVTCSSLNVMAQAVQLWRLDALPRDVTIRKAESPTASGFYPLWLDGSGASEAVPF